MNLTRLSWTRLISSRYKQELEALRSRLAKAGILSEIRDNLVSTRRGMTRFEIVVDERDLFRASKICQHGENGAEAGQPVVAAGSPRVSSGFARAEDAQSPPASDVGAQGAGETEEVDSVAQQDQKPTGPEGEFAKVAALLEKHVDELLSAQVKSREFSEELEAKVKNLDQALVNAKAALDAERLQHDGAEKKLTELSAARDLLQKEIQVLESRCRAAEEQLANAEARRAAQAQEIIQQLRRSESLEKALAGRDAELRERSETLAATQKDLEHEKELRLAAEQKCHELVNAQKALEAELLQQLRQREQLLKERHEEQMRDCVGKVNALYSRVKNALASKEQP